MLATGSDMGILEPAKRTQKAVDEAIMALEGAGATVDRVNLNLDRTPADISGGFSSMALAGAMGGMFAEYADEEEC